jgi:hypothetical protein
MAKLTILDSTKGHRTVEFDNTDIADIMRADAVLQETLQKGWSAFREDTGKRVTTVERNAEEIIVIPPIAGG